MIELLCEVLSICHKISTGSDADVFLDYTPHVNGYSVYYYFGGWKENTKPDCWVSMVRQITEENLEETIQKLYLLAEVKGVKL